MRVLVQRVSQGAVRVEGQTVGRIGRGYVLLVGIGEGDTPEQARKMAQKVANLRLFPNEAGKFDRSLLEVGGEALVVSQFTLYADTRRGRRPSFTAAAPPEIARPLVDHFAQCLRELGVTSMQTGRFGESMEVEIWNQGPVTIWLDSKELEA